MAKRKRRKLPRRCRRVLAVCTVAGRKLRNCHKIIRKKGRRRKGGRRRK